MHRADFITAFQNSGEVTTEHLTQLAAAVQGGKIEDVAGAAIDAALPEFSRNSPRVATKTGTWGGADVTLDEWARSSRILSVECPTGSRPRTMLPLSTVEVAEDTGAVYFLSAPTGAAYAVRYTAPHQVPAMPTGGSGTPEDVTIPTDLHQVYFTLCAAIVFDRLAGRYAGSTGTTFAADAVNYQSKSAEYTRLAAEARKRYRVALGLPAEPALEPAGFAVDVELDDWRVFEEASWPT